MMWILQFFFRLRVFGRISRNRYTEMSNIASSSDIIAFPFIHLEDNLSALEVREALRYLPYILTRSLGGLLDSSYGGHATVRDSQQTCHCDSGRNTKAKRFRMTVRPWESDYLLVPVLLRPTSRTERPQKAEIYSYRSKMLQNLWRN